MMNFEYTTKEIQEAKFDRKAFDEKRHQMYLDFEMKYAKAVHDKAEEFLISGAMPRDLMVTQTQRKLVEVAPMVLQLQQEFRVV